MWIIPGLLCCVDSCENAYIKQISRREKAGPWATLCSSHWTREPPLTLCISTLQSDHVLRIALLCTQPLTHIHSHACNYMHPPANLFPRTLNAAPPHLGSSFYRRYQPTYLQPSQTKSNKRKGQYPWSKGRLVYLVSDRFCNLVMNTFAHETCCVFIPLHPPAVVFSLQMFWQLRFYLFLIYLMYLGTRFALSFLTSTYLPR